MSISAVRNMNVAPEELSKDKQGDLVLLSVRKGLAPAEQMKNFAITQGFSELNGTIPLPPSSNSSWREAINNLAGTKIEGSKRIDVKIVNKENLFYIVEQHFDWKEEKLLFGMGQDHIQYLKEGPISAELMMMFANHDITVPSGVKLTQKKDRLNKWFSIINGKSYRLNNKENQILEVCEEDKTWDLKMELNMTIKVVKAKDYAKGFMYDCEVIGNIENSSIKQKLKELYDIYMVSVDDKRFRSWVYDMVEGECLGKHVKKGMWYVPYSSMETLSKVEKIVDEWERITPDNGHNMVKTEFVRIPIIGNQKLIAWTAAKVSQKIEEDWSKLLEKVIEDIKNKEENQIEKIIQKASENAGKLVSAREAFINDLGDTVAAHLSKMDINSVPEDQYGRASLIRSLTLKSITPTGLYTTIST